MDRGEASRARVVLSCTMRYCTWYRSVERGECAGATLERGRSGGTMKNCYYAGGRIDAGRTS